MTYEPQNSPDLFDELEHGDSASPLKGALKLLRGRWHWAILFSMLLGAAGLYLGYNIQKDQYQGTSTIELKPNFNVAVDIQDLSQFESYRNFVSSQVRALFSHEVIESAMAQPEWQDSMAQRSADLPPISVEAFSNQLKITPPFNNETIMTVEFTDQDPKTASAGVNALLAAYQQTHKRAQTEQIDENLRLLKDQLSSLESEKTITERQINLVIPSDETLTITSRLDSKLRELASFEYRLSEIDLTLKPYLDALNNPDASRELLVPDPMMTALLEEKKQLEDRYTDLTEVLGRGDEMPDVVNVRRSLTIVNRKIVELENSQFAAPDSGDINSMPPMVADLMSKRSVILNKIEELNAETSDLGTRISAVEDYKVKIQDLRQSIRETQDKINQYESTLNFSQNDDVSRIVIGPQSQTPTKPFNTDKRIMMSGAGLVFGMSMGFGLVMMVGLMDRRIRHASDTYASMPEANVLGVLPTLPANLTDPDEAEAVAHCVHHIRTLLQIGGSNRVFSITSPTAGSGKSSLATALGMSFSASGVSTLMIDADLVGAGLSRRMGTVVHESLDAVIRRHGMLGEAELARAMTLATSQQQPLDSVLIEEGLMDHDQLDTAVRLQRDTSLGLLNACQPGKLRNCVASAGIDGLYILPVGRAKPADASRLSPAAMRELIRQAREAFDIVLIDTGPVLGSLEASIAAAESDATVVIVSRGDQKSLVARSLDQLRSVRAQIAGLVFNHALDRDLDHVSYASQVSQERRPDRSVRKKTLDKHRSARLGPLGTAVASYSEEEANGTNGTYNPADGAQRGRDLDS